MKTDGLSLSAATEGQFMDGDEAAMQQ